jgi:hypothetical protein
MALPPEPLAEVLPLAVTVVEGEVTGVEDLGAWPAPDKGALLDAAAPRPPQRVTVRIARSLRGTARGELVVTKPAAGYALRAGVRGAFLVDAAGTLLGRYGPDTYDPAEVVHAIGSAP